MRLTRYAKRYEMFSMFLVVITIILGMLDSVNDFPFHEDSSAGIKQLPF